MAAAETASGGDTMAPSANAVGQDRPGASACAATPTQKVVKTTAPIARSEMAARLLRNSVQAFAGVQRIVAGPHHRANGTWSSLLIELPAKCLSTSPAALGKPPKAAHSVRRIERTAQAPLR